TFTFDNWKGKYIYIDFWATWCGPCIQEIPSLKKLEHDYADKKIVFVSISMDRERDRQKWIDFVRKEKLEGIQVWLDAANNKQISQAFNILQIPRFVLLDDKGQIVDANAPRPSDDRIRTILDKLL
ncbi:TlpA family protein disulfide reductase, partial [Parapusillimonas sp. SGNA-6]|nr:TlpA family protein disulfide reductase [Parapusillimonas sp. SGNA-6]